MTDDIIEVKETVHDGKNYVIAYSLREQKRSNDLKEAFYLLFGLLSPCWYCSTQSSMR